MQNYGPLCYSKRVYKTFFTTNQLRILPPDIKRQVQKSYLDRPQEILEAQTMASVPAPACVNYTMLLLPDSRQIYKVASNTCNLELVVEVVDVVSVI